MFVFVFVSIIVFVFDNVSFRCQFLLVSSITSLRCRPHSPSPCQPPSPQSPSPRCRYFYLYMMYICICCNFVFVCVTYLYFFLQLTGQSIPVTVSNLVSSLQTPLPQSSFLSQASNPETNNFMYFLKLLRLFLQIILCIFTNICVQFHKYLCAHSEIILLVCRCRRPRACPPSPPSPPSSPYPPSPPCP